jgi:hypothetical protein
MEAYDPHHAPDPGERLKLTEDERMELVRRCAGLERLTAESWRSG